MRFSLKELLLVTTVAAVCFAAWQARPGFPAISLLSMLVGGMACRVLACHWKGWWLGALVGLSAVTGTDRIALEYIPRRGAPALPLGIYLATAAGAGVFGGLVWRVARLCKYSEDSPTRNRAQPILPQHEK